MAAGLQCLTATPTVQHHFLQLQENSEKLPPPGSLMSNFSFLLSEMWSGAHDVLHPTEFKKALGLHHSQFKDYRQHDCQEFLALLLDSLHEQMNLAKTNNSCYVPSATATSASSTICTDINLNTNDDLYALRTSSITASNVSKFMDELDDGPPSFEDGPNSPNITMAGSPKDSLDDMDSTANSARSSPMEIDEETLDSEDIVPLPHAMERQFSVTYVSADGTQPIHCVITLNKMQKLKNLKMELVEMLDKKDVHSYIMIV
ncbi:unnamed protein product [Trichogramma brassicae]|uniref:ubiquitinyl hydrolase 1 n=1 Tax=Trichogramma brassicae TaxID=86971 RepID=A0A6H5IH98_9HYME|nr:unnamed protein product [Trichogramma brassicae]